MNEKRTREHVTAAPVPERGWIFDVEDRHEGALSSAEIVEVLTVPGYTMFRVRWEDGSESTFVPACGHHAHPPRERVV
jgi:Domain of unknown function (DUF1918)